MNVDNESPETEIIEIVDESKDVENCDIWVSSTQRIRVNDVMDVKDSTGHWCEAVIEKIDNENQRLFVSYVNWDSKYDEWISDVESTIAALNTHTYKEGGVLKVGQRIEVLDTQKKWMQSFVIDSNEDQVKVHYLNWSPNFDEWLDRSSYRIRPFVRETKKLSNKRLRPRQWRVPGSNQMTTSMVMVDSSFCDSQQIDNHFSSVSTNPVKRNNFCRNDSTSINYNPSDICNDDRTRRITQYSDQFVHYSMSLEAQRMLLVPIPGDGNCLFRSVAHQVYGDHELHWIVRQKCMDYMEAEADFFSQFVEGGMDTFPHYIREKRKLACWGDDPEIQAMSEIYDRPADIWCYDRVRGARLMRTFHEAAGSAHRQPICLSYYGGGHYDSIVDPGSNNAILRRTPGDAEDDAVARVRARSAMAVTSGGLNNMRRSTDTEATERELLDIAIQVSRNEHLAWAEEDLAYSLAMSLDSNSEHSSGEEKSEGSILQSLSSSVMSRRQLLGDTDQNTNLLVSQEGQILDRIARESEKEFIENEILKTITAETTLNEEEEIRRAKQESLVDITSLSSKDGDVTSGDNLLQELKQFEMTEEEIINLAIKESMKHVVIGYDHGNVPMSSYTSPFAPEYPSARPAMSIPSASEKSGDVNSDDNSLYSMEIEEDELARAIRMSMQGTYGADTMDNDLEIDLERAIFESLR